MRGKIEKLSDKKMINPKMGEIIRILNRRGGAMSANEITKISEMSYTTVANYLKKLESWYIILRINKDGSESTGKVTPVKKIQKKDKRGKLRTLRGQTIRYKLNYFRIRPVNHPAD